MSTIKSSAENLTLNADGANNDIKFQSNGSEVASIDQAGVIVSAGGSTHADNVKAKFGTGNDLEIYHDASHSYIKDVGTGNLYIDGANNIILRTDTGEWFARCEKDAQVALYHNNAEKLATTATGVAVTGGVAIGGTGAANTLDDYEEGTWTPVMKDSSDRALSTNTGSSGAIYVKIGRQVTVTGRITTDSLGSASGQLNLTGLPFAAYGSSIGGYSGGTVGRAGNLNIASGTNIAFAVTYGQTYCEMTSWDDSVGTTDMQVSEWSADGWIMFCLVYQTA